jgi:hypothetical protein
MLWRGLVTPAVAVGLVVGVIAVQIRGIAVSR